MSRDTITSGDANNFCGEMHVLKKGASESAAEFFPKLTLVRVT